MGDTSKFLDSMSGVFHDIREERRRQDEKWGATPHTMTRWAAILSEENGEFAEASLQFGNTLADRTHIKPLAAAPDPHIDLIGKLRTEAVHVAAVAVAILQQIDREVEAMAPSVNEVACCRSSFEESDKAVVGLLRENARRELIQNGHAEDLADADADFITKAQNADR
jgi:hypothetical protein